MNNPWNKREKILQDDNRKDLIEKRNKQSKDFGKKRIFSLFQEGYTYYKDNPSDERFEFTVGSIIEKIKQQKNKVYLKGTKKESKRAASEIASLFGKFIHVMNKTSVDIEKEFVQPKNIETLHPIIEKNTQYIQLELFKEFDDLQDKIKSVQYKGNDEKNQTQLSSKDFVIKESFSQKAVDTTIDLDALYASDPDEPWRNR